MSNDIKLSPINQKIIQDKQTNQNSANTDLKVPDNKLKQDTFVNSRKKAITFGSILGGIGLAVGATVLAYKGKLGSKAQSFVEGFINKTNKFSDSVATATSKTTPSVPTEKTTIPTATAKIDVQDKIELPQKPVQEIQQPVATKPIQEVVEVDKVVPENPIEVPNEAVKEVISVDTDKLQAEQPIEKAVEAPAMNKVIHDISGGAESYEVKLRFSGSDEEITLIAPKNPSKTVNGKIYKKLKNAWGENGRNLAMREFQISDTDYTELQEDFCKNINEVIAGNTTKGMTGCFCNFVQKNVKFANLNNDAVQAINKIFEIFDNQKATINDFDDKIKTEIIDFLNSLKINTIDKYKKIYLAEVDDVYSFIDKEITPLQETYHYYRGVASGCLLNEIKDGSDTYMTYLSNLKVGNTITPDYGAMFVTASPEYATNYAHKDGVLFHIILPKGAKIGAGRPGEDLLPPMAKFKVVGNKQIGKDGFRVIDLEYLIDQGTRSL